MTDSGDLRVQSSGDKGDIQDADAQFHSEADIDTEEEPRLKYQRLGSDVVDLLGKDSATCLCVSDKILALGTHSGTVHVLDYNGNEVCVINFFL
jgi:hypothetical protein